MLVIALILGGLAGVALGHGFSGFVVGALVGGFIALVVRMFGQRNAASAADAAHVASLERRIDHLESTVARLVSRQYAADTAHAAQEPGAREPGAQAEVPTYTPPPAAAASPVMTTARAVADAVDSTPPPMPAYGARASASASAAAATVDATSAPVATVDAASPPVATADATSAPFATVDATSASATSGARPAAAPPSFEVRARRWITEGNVPARLGVIVLLFGVAFLLRYFAERFTVPIEARLGGVALGGAALIALGARMTSTRAAWGLAVEGAGCGVLYLTTFAAFRLFGVLPSQVAIAALVAVAALSVWLAVRSDSQPLAGLAIAGGFLAPVLVGGGGSPLPLFAWFAVLNAAVVALAWRHSWRVLNLVGFVFTFVLAIGWGARFYQPQYFTIVEPFLILFFIFYVAVAVLYAKQQPLEMGKPVDGLLVFGVPLIGFALQFALVRGARFGAAWSALAVALVYGVLYAALRRRGEPGLALLARAFGALAVVFVTVAVPNALDARWTSAWWAVEAACVYWIGCRQSQPLARGFALLLQLAAAVVFLANRVDTSSLTPFANAAFAGSTMIAVAAFVTAWLAEHEPTLTPRERVVAPCALAWATAWWLLGGIHEIQRQHSASELPSLALAWCAATALASLLLQRALRWPRLAWSAAPVLPVVVLATFAAWTRDRTTLTHAGPIVWPASFALHWALLRIADRGDATLQALRREGVHAASALVLVGWLAWEVSEWTGRHTEPHTVWIACAAAWTGIVALWLCVAPASAARWPVASHQPAYTRIAGGVIAVCLVAWITIVDVLSPGDASPLPYIPLVNPLDLTLLLALGVLAMWLRRAVTLPERDRRAVLAIAGFVALNGAVLRAGHHLGGIEWSLRALLASRPLQAALTLTWTATALVLMLLATRRGLRAWWSAGAVLLAIVIAKLFLVDLATLSGLARVAAFLGVGVLLLVIGYVAPFPPAAADASQPPRA